MTIIRSILLFVVVAAIAEIGGAWLIWQGVREHKDLLWIGAGIAALGAYGFVATLQPDPTSAASSPPTAASSSPAPPPGASLSTKFRPDRYDLVGAGISLLSVVIIMYVPRH